MKIIDMFKVKKPVISFEIFPPKPDTPLETVYDTLLQFSEMRPDFISVTYGAGGSMKDRTIEIAARIKSMYGIESMAHFTCTGHSVEEVNEMTGDMHRQGLENILALRGDPPRDRPDFDFSKNAFRYASELIRHIRGRNGFCIAAAAYLEGHAECRRLSEDAAFLRRKVDEGVDFLISQLFFDNRLYYDFLDRMAAHGIDCPLTPGIMPVFKADQIKRITALCNASIPAGLVLLMDKYADNPDDMRKAGIEYASIQMRDLIENGASGVHLCTMNRPGATREILSNIGLKARLKDQSCL